MRQFFRILMAAILLVGPAAAAIPTAQAVGTLQTSQLPDGVVGQAYSVQLQGSGTGTITYEKWYFTYPGSSMTLSSTGLLSGTPTQAGTYELGVRVSDNTGSGTYSVLSWKVTGSGTSTSAPVISAIQGYDPSVTPAYTTNQATSGTYVVLYGSFAANGNQLISTGNVSGTISYQSTNQINILLANNTGTATFSISNSNGTSASKSIAVVAPGTTVASTLTLTEALANGSTAIPAGTQNYTFAYYTLRTGNTPVTITSLRVVSDSASKDQFSNIRIYKDGSSFVGGTAQSLNVINGTTRYTQFAFSPALTIPANSSSTLELSASVSTATTGTMRLGIDALQNNGTVITTTPNTPFYGPSVPVTGGTGSTTTLAITTAAQLSDGVVNTPYATTFTATGGTAPYTWDILPGQYTTYPCCYTSLQSNGTFTSVNTGAVLPFAGTFQVPVRVTDAVGATAQKIVTWTVRTAPTPTPTPTPITSRVVEGYIDSVSANSLSGWAYTNMPTTGSTPSVYVVFENVSTGAAGGNILFYPTTVRNDVAAFLQTKYGVSAYNTATGFNTFLSSLFVQNGTYRIRSATFDGTPITLSEAAKQPFTIGQTTTTGGPVSKYVKVEGNATVYWVTSWGAKMPVLSAQVFLSYGGRWEDVVTVSQEILDAYDDVEYIKLSGNARVYKIEGGVKRYLTPAAASRLNINPATVVTVNPTEFAAYRTGSTIK